MPNLKELKVAELRKLAKKAKIENWEELEREGLLKALGEPEEEEETESGETEGPDDEEESEEEEEIALKDMSVRELRAVAKEENVNIKGLRKKSDIIKAIDGVDEVEESEDVDEVKKVEDGVVTPGVEEVRFQSGGKAARMKAKLAKQRKVRVIVQLMDGEKRGSTMSVILNGYRLNIQKGVYVDVPEQIADIIMESQQQTVLASEHELLLKDKKEELDVL